MALPGASGAQGLASAMADNKPTDPERPLMLHGFTTASKNLASVHPLEGQLGSYGDRMDAMNFAMLQKTQGIAAPLKLMMERDAASRITRLPFLPSSNIMLDVLTGRDEEVSIEDVLGDPSQPELMGAPHLMVERKLGLL